MYIYIYIRWAQTCKLCNYCMGQWWPSRKCLNWVFLGWATLPHFFWDIYTIYLYVHIYACVCACVCKHFWIYTFIFTQFDVYTYRGIYIYIWQSSVYAYRYIFNTWGAQTCSAGSNVTVYIVGAMQLMQGIIISKHKGFLSVEPLCHLYIYICVCVCMYM